MPADINAKSEVVSYDINGNGDFVNTRPETALSIAVGWGCDDIADYALKNGAKVDECAIRAYSLLSERENVGQDVKDKISNLLQIDDKANNKEELLVKDKTGVEYNLYDLPEGFVFDGNIDLSNHNLFKLPDLSKVRVTGNFNCSNNYLTSFEGAPRRVGGSFDCSNNYLTSLYLAPQVDKVITGARIFLAEHRLFRDSQ